MRRLPVLAVRDYIAAAWLTLASGITYMCPWLDTWGPIAALTCDEQMVVEGLFGLHMVSVGFLLRATGKRWACALACCSWVLQASAYAWTDRAGLELMLSSVMAVILAASCLEGAACRSIRRLAG